MDSVAERLTKLREERIAREKARIEKLRDLNLKKYNKPSDPPKNSTGNISLIKKGVVSEINLKNNTTGVKNNAHSCNVPKRSISAPPKPQIKQTKPKNHVNHVRQNTIAENIEKNTAECKTLPAANKKAMGPPNKLYEKKLPMVRQVSNTTKSNPSEKKLGNPTHKKPFVLSTNTTRKSMFVNEKRKMNVTRKSLAPTSKNQNMVKPPQTSRSLTANNSVFERLYKTKTSQSAHSSDVEKLQTDPDYLKKVIRTTGLILNKRHTVFETKPHVDVPVRRSISAVHFKRISKSELANCMHKWSSIGEKLNNVHLKHLNEDEKVNQDKVVSAVKSERKKVKFMTPMTNFNTPRPEELQARLKAWLQKRGKSLDSYHHLQCFGIHHLPHKLQFDSKVYDDEDKENIAVENDSDNESYAENMNDEAENMNNKWRRASVVSDCVDINETQDTITTCSDIVNTNEVLIGALNDLTELLKEGFDWEQCARWLRAVRERFPAAPHCAAYWECRAALEERRGDLPASVQCWEEAIAKGTEQSVVEANLDQLLDKFMQLKISPNSGKSRRQVDPKLVDVKNVFKSTIIRFAVQQAKLRQSNQFSPAPKFCVTPVRRSARLSVSSNWTGKRTPLQVCSSVRQADELAGEKVIFVPNENLNGTP